MKTLKLAMSRVDDMALAVWRKPLARRVGSLVLLTVMADFANTKTNSAAVTYAQHMLAAVQPVVEPAVKALSF